MEANQISKQRFHRLINGPEDVRPGQQELTDQMRLTFPRVFQTDDGRRLTPEQRTRAAVFSPVAQSFVREFGRNLKRRIHREASRWTEQAPRVDARLLALAGRIQADTAESVGLHLTISEALFVARTAQQNRYDDHPFARLDASTLVLLPCILEAACATR